MGNITLSELKGNNIEADRKYQAISTSFIYNNRFLNSLLEEIPYYNLPNYSELADKEPQDNKEDEELNNIYENNWFNKLLIIYSESSNENIANVNDYEVLTTLNPDYKSNYCNEEQKRVRFMIRIFQACLNQLNSLRNSSSPDSSDGSSYSKHWKKPTIIDNNRHFNPLTSKVNSLDEASLSKLSIGVTLSMAKSLIIHSPPLACAMLSSLLDVLVSLPLSSFPLKATNSDKSSISSCPLQSIYDFVEEMFEENKNLSKDDKCNEAFSLAFSIRFSLILLSGSVNLLIDNLNLLKDYNINLDQRVIKLLSKVSKSTSQTVLKESAFFQSTFFDLIPPKPKYNPTGFINIEVPSLATNLDSQLINPNSFSTTSDSSYFYLYDGSNGGSIYKFGIEGGSIPGDLVSSTSVSVRKSISNYLISSLNAESNLNSTSSNTESILTEEIIESDNFWKSWAKEEQSLEDDVNDNDTNKELLSSLPTFSGPIHQSFLYSSQISNSFTKIVVDRLPQNKVKFLAFDNIENPFSAHPISESESESESESDDSDSYITGEDEGDDDEDDDDINSDDNNTVDSVSFSMNYENQQQDSTSREFLNDDEVTQEPDQGENQYSSIRLKQYNTMVLVPRSSYTIYTNARVPASDSPSYCYYDALSSVSSPIYYFECEVKSDNVINYNTSIGFTVWKNGEFGNQYLFPRSHLYFGSFIGGMNDVFVNRNYAVHIQDTPISQIFEAEEIVYGFGLNLETKKVFYTINGELIYTMPLVLTTRGIEQNNNTPWNDSHFLVPTVFTRSSTIQLNMGQKPFLFTSFEGQDIGSMPNLLSQFDAIDQTSTINQTNENPDSSTPQSTSGTSRRIRTLPDEFLSNFPNDGSPLNKHSNSSTNSDTKKYPLLPGSLNYSDNYIYLRTSGGLKPYEVAVFDSSNLNFIKILSLQNAIDSYSLKNENKIAVASLNLYDNSLSQSSNLNKNEKNYFKLLKENRIGVLKNYTVEFNKHDYLFLKLLINGSLILKEAKLLKNGDNIPSLDVFKIVSEWVSESFDSIIDFEMTLKERWPLYSSLYLSFVVINDDHSSGLSLPFTSLGSTFVFTRKNLTFSGNDMASLFYFPLIDVDFSNCEINLNSLINNSENKFSYSGPYNENGNISVDPNVIKEMWIDFNKSKHIKSKLLTSTPTNATSPLPSNSTSITSQSDSESNSEKQIIISYWNKIISSIRGLLIQDNSFEFFSTLTLFFNLNVKLESNSSVIFNSSVKFFNLQFQWKNLFNTVYLKYKSSYFKNNYEILFFNLFKYSSSQSESFILTEQILLSLNNRVNSSNKLKTVSNPKKLPDFNSSLVFYNGYNIVFMRRVNRLDGVITFYSSKFSIYNINEIENDENFLLENELVSFPNLKQEINKRIAILTDFYISDFNPKYIEKSSKPFITPSLSLLPHAISYNIKSNLFLGLDCSCKTIIKWRNSGMVPRQLGYLSGLPVNLLEKYEGSYDLSSVNLFEIENDNILSANSNLRSLYFNYKIQEIYFNNTLSQYEKNSYLTSWILALLDRNSEAYSPPPVNTGLEIDPAFEIKLIAYPAHESAYNDTKSGILTTPNDPSLTLLPEVSSSTYVSTVLSGSCTFTYLSKVLNFYTTSQFSIFFVDIDPATNRIIKCWLFEVISIDDANHLSESICGVDVGHIILIGTSGGFTPTLRKHCNSSFMSFGSFDLMNDDYVRSHISNSSSFVYDSTSIGSFLMIGVKGLIPGLADWAVGPSHQPLVLQRTLPPLDIIPYCLEPNTTTIQSLNNLLEHYLSFYKQNEDQYENFNKFLINDKILSLLNILTSHLHQLVFHFPAGSFKLDEKLKKSLHNNLLFILTNDDTQKISELKDITTKVLLLLTDILFEDVDSKIKIIGEIGNHLIVSDKNTEKNGNLISSTDIILLTVLLKSLNAESLIRYAYSSSSNNQTISNENSKDLKFNKEVILNILSLLRNIIVYENKNYLNLFKEEIINKLISYLPTVTSTFEFQNVNLPKVSNFFSTYYHLAVNLFNNLSKYLLTLSTETILNNRSKLKYDGFFFEIINLISGISNDIILPLESYSKEIIFITALIRQYYTLNPNNFNYDTVTAYLKENLYKDNNQFNITKKILDDIKLFFNSFYSDLLFDSPASSILPIAILNLQQLLEDDSKFSSTTIKSISSSYALLSQSMELSLSLVSSLNETLSSLNSLIYNYLPPSESNFSDVNLINNSTVRKNYESPHPYLSNMNTTIEVSFPGALYLVIEFDPRSRTETNCDYLQFLHPITGAILHPDVERYSGRDGSENFPGFSGRPPLTIKRSDLTFIFKSDGSVEDWGYAFTITAHFPTTTVSNTVPSLIFNNQINEEINLYGGTYLEKKIKLYKKNSKKAIIEDNPNEDNDHSNSDIPQYKLIKKDSKQSPFLKLSFDLVLLLSTVGSVLMKGISWNQDFETNYFSWIENPLVSSETLSSYDETLPISESLSQSMNLSSPYLSSTASEESSLYSAISDPAFQFLIQLSNYTGKENDILFGDQFVKMKNFISSIKKIVRIDQGQQEDVNHAVYSTCAILIKYNNLAAEAYALYNGTRTKPSNAFTHIWTVAQKIRKHFSSKTEKVVNNDEEIEKINKEICNKIVSKTKFLLLSSLKLLSNNVPSISSISTSSAEKDSKHDELGLSTEGLDNSLPQPPFTPTQNKWHLAMKASASLVRRQYSEDTKNAAVMLESLVQESVALNKLRNIIKSNRIRAAAENSSSSELSSVSNDSLCDRILTFILDDFEMKKLKELSNLRNKRAIARAKGIGIFLDLLKIKKFNSLLGNIKYDDIDENSIYKDDGKDNTPKSYFIHPFSVYLSTKKFLQTLKLLKESISSDINGQRPDNDNNMPFYYGIGLNGCSNNLLSVLKSKFSQLLVQIVHALEFSISKYSLLKDAISILKSDQNKSKMNESLLTSFEGYLKTWEATILILIQSFSQDYEFSDNSLLSESGLIDILKNVIDSNISPKIHTVSLFVLELLTSRYFSPKLSGNQAILIHSNINISYNIGFNKNLVRVMAQMLSGVNAFDYEEDELELDLSPSTINKDLIEGELNYPMFNLSQSIKNELKFDVEVNQKAKNKILFSKALTEINDYLPNPLVSISAELNLHKYSNSFVVPNVDIPITHTISLWYKRKRSNNIDFNEYSPNKTFEELPLSFIGKKVIRGFNWNSIIEADGKVLPDSNIFGKIVEVDKDQAKIEWENSSIMSHPVIIPPQLNPFSVKKEENNFIIQNYSHPKSPYTRFVHLIDQSIEGYIFSKGTLMAVDRNLLLSDESFCLNYLSLYLNYDASLILTYQWSGIDGRYNGPVFVNLPITLPPDAYVNITITCDSRFNIIIYLNSHEFYRIALPIGIDVSGIFDDLDYKEEEMKLNNGTYSQEFNFSKMNSSNQPLLPPNDYIKYKKFNSEQNNSSVNGITLWFEFSNISINCNYSINFYSKTSNQELLSITPQTISYYSLNSTDLKSLPCFVLPFDDIYYNVTLHNPITASSTISNALSFNLTCQVVTSSILDFYSENIMLDTPFYIGHPHSSTGKMVNSINHTAVGCIKGFTIFNETLTSNQIKNHCINQYESIITKSQIIDEDSHKKLLHIASLEEELSVLNVFSLLKKSLEHSDPLQLTINSLSVQNSLSISFNNIFSHSGIVAMIFDKMTGPYWSPTIRSSAYQICSKLLPNLSLELVDGYAKRQGWLTCPVTNREFDGFLDYLISKIGWFYSSLARSYFIENENNSHIIEEKSLKESYEDYQGVLSSMILLVRSFSCSANKEWRDKLSQILLNISKNSSETLKFIINQANIDMKTVSTVPINPLNQDSPIDTNHPYIKAMKSIKTSLTAEEELNLSNLFGLFALLGITPTISVTSIGSLVVYNNTEPATVLGVSNYNEFIQSNKLTMNSEYSNEPSYGSFIRIFLHSKPSESLVVLRKSITPLDEFDVTNTDNASCSQSNLSKNSKQKKNTPVINNSPLDKILYLKKHFFSFVKENLGINFIKNLSCTNIMNEKDLLIDDRYFPKVKKIDSNFTQVSHYNTPHPFVNNYTEIIDCFELPTKTIYIFFDERSSLPPGYSIQFFKDFQCVATLSDKFEGGLPLTLPVNSPSTSYKPSNFPGVNSIPQLCLSTGSFYFVIKPPNTKPEFNSWESFNDVPSHWGIKFTMLYKTSKTIIPPNLPIIPSYSLLIMTRTLSLKLLSQVVTLFPEIIYKNSHLLDDSEESDIDINNNTSYETDIISNLFSHSLSHIAPDSENHDDLLPPFTPIHTYSSESTVVKTFESTHPYADNLNEIICIHIPFAKKLIITFDPSSRTELNCDFIQFCTTDSCTTQIPNSERYSGGRDGSSTNFPGTGGRPPLVFLGNRCYLNFKSDASVNDWGYKIYVQGIIKSETDLKNIEYSLSYRGQECGYSINNSTETESNKKTAEKSINNKGNLAFECNSYLLSLIYDSGMKAKKYDDNDYLKIIKKLSSYDFIKPVKLESTKFNNYTINSIISSYTSHSTSSNSSSLVQPQLLKKLAYIKKFKSISAITLDNNHITEEKENSPSFPAGTKFIVLDESTGRWKVAVVDTYPNPYDSSFVANLKEQNIGYIDPIVDQDYLGRIEHLYEFSLADGESVGPNLTPSKSPQSTASSSTSTTSSSTTNLVPPAPSNPMYDLVDTSSTVDFKSNNFDPNFCINQNVSNLHQATTDYYTLASSTYVYQSLDKILDHIVSKLPKANYSLISSLNNSSPTNSKGFFKNIDCNLEKIITFMQLCLFYDTSFHHSLIEKIVELILKYSFINKDDEKYTHEFFNFILKQIELSSSPSKNIFSSSTPKSGIAMQIESQHPYEPKVSKDYEISFPGATRIEIHFDPKSCTEYSSDYITIYSNPLNNPSSPSPSSSSSSSSTKEKLYNKKIHGELTNTSRHWPGVNVPPVVITKTNNIILSFTSKSSRSDFGFIAYIYAFYDNTELSDANPISKRFSKILDFNSLALYILSYLSKNSKNLILPEKTHNYLYSYNNLHHLKTLFILSSNNVLNVSQLLLFINHFISQLVQSSLWVSNDEVFKVEAYRSLFELKTIILIYLQHLSKKHNAANNSNYKITPLFQKTLQLWLTLDNLTQNLSLSGIVHPYLITSATPTSLTSFSSSSSLSTTSSLPGSPVASSLNNPSIQSYINPNKSKTVLSTITSSSKSFISWIVKFKKLTTKSSPYIGIIETNNNEKNILNKSTSFSSSSSYYQQPEPIGLGTGLNQIALNDNNLIINGKYYNNFLTKSKSFQVGDTLAIMYDTLNNTLSYSLNGILLGVAVSNCALANYVPFDQAIPGSHSNNTIISSIISTFYSSSPPSVSTNADAKYNFVKNNLLSLTSSNYYLPYVHANLSGKEFTLGLTLPSSDDEVEIISNLYPLKEAPPSISTLLFKGIRSISTPINSPITFSPIKLPNTTLTWLNPILIVNSVLKSITNKELPDFCTTNYFLPYCNLKSSKFYELFDYDFNSIVYNAIGNNKDDKSTENSAYITHDIVINCPNADSLNIILHSLSLYPEESLEIFSNSTSTSFSSSLQIFPSSSVSIVPLKSRPKTVSLGMEENDKKFNSGNICISKTSSKLNLLEKENQLLSSKTYQESILALKKGVEKSLFDSIIDCVQKQSIRNRYGESLSYSLIGLFSSSDSKVSQKVGDKVIKISYLNELDSISIGTIGEILEIDDDNIKIIWQDSSSTTNIYSSSILNKKVLAPYFNNSSSSFSGYTLSAGGTYSFIYTNSITLRFNLLANTNNMKGKRELLFSVIPTLQPSFCFNNPTFNSIHEYLKSQYILGYNLNNSNLFSNEEIVDYELKNDSEKLMNLTDKKNIDDYHTITPFKILTRLINRHADQNNLTFTDLALLNYEGLNITDDDFVANPLLKTSSQIKLSQILTNFHDIDNNDLVILESLKNYVEKDYNLKKIISGSAIYFNDMLNSDSQSSSISINNTTDINDAINNASQSNNVTNLDGVAKKNYTLVLEGPFENTYLENYAYWAGIYDFEDLQNATLAAKEIYPECGGITLRHDRVYTLRAGNVLRPSENDSPDSMTSGVQSWIIKKEMINEDNDLDNDEEEDSYSESEIESFSNPIGLNEDSEAGEHIESIEVSIEDNSQSAEVSSSQETTDNNNIPENLEINNEVTDDQSHNDDSESDDDHDNDHEPDNANEDDISNIHIDINEPYDILYEPLKCKCNRSVTRHPPHTCPGEWYCNCPDHTGSSSFYNTEYVHGCSNVDVCDYHICDTCVLNHRKKHRLKLMKEKKANNKSKFNNNISILNLQYNILKLFNTCISETIPYIDLTLISHENNKAFKNIIEEDKDKSNENDEIILTLTQNLSLYRFLIYNTVKNKPFLDIINETMKPSPNLFDLTLSRVSALRFANEGKVDTQGKWTVFSQAFRAIHPMGPQVFRVASRFYSTKFSGEYSQDAGGPFRESIDMYAQELQSSALPLLILSPNGRHAIGMNRDKWVFNPASKNNQLYRDMLVFLGKFMGYSIRSNDFIPLNFPSIIWKKLVGDVVTLEDIENVDFSFAQIIKLLCNFDKDDNESNDPESIHMKNEIFNETFYETFFNITATDDSIEEIIPNGNNIQVTTENFRAYCNLIYNYRINEFNWHIDAVREGLQQVVPIHLLNLFTYEELEIKVCGQAQVNIDLLEKMTEYSGCSPTDANIINFWKIMRQFNNEERSAFLRFTWGRSRLPINEAGFTQKFKLQNFTKSPPDAYLPVAHTCFFSIELPRYSTLEIMREKLRYAIFNCTAIDTDGNFNANNNAWDDQE